MKGLAYWAVTAWLVCGCGGLSAEAKSHWIYPKEAWTEETPYVSEEYEARLELARAYQHLVEDDEKWAQVLAIAGEFEQLLDENEQVILREEVLDSLNLAEIEELCASRMACHFTQEEIQSLISFEQSSGGRALLHKLPLFVADFFEAIASELLLRVVQREELP